MDKIKESLRKPVVTAVVGFLIGLIVGLPILGWLIFPVEWNNAAIEHLRTDLKAEYLKLAIQSYAYDPGKPELALKRWEALGDEAPDILTSLQSDPDLKPVDIAVFTQLVTSGMAIPMPTSAPDEGEGAPTSEAPTPEAVGTIIFASPTPVTNGDAKKPPINPVLLIGLFCAMTLVVGGALAYVLLIRKKGGGGIKLFGSSQKAREANLSAERTDFEAEGQEPPVAQFMTTYVQGDDLYDDSFSIDAPNGEFLGECGVGISETIGVGDPKKVSAFEIWLFDKNDIQTITKVLMSEHAFNDPVANRRLAAKGEPVLVREGEHVLLETQTLILEARVVDAKFGQGALPPNSYFEQLTLELAIWQK